MSSSFELEIEEPVSPKSKIYCPSDFRYLIVIPLGLFASGLLCAAIYYQVAICNLYPNYQELQCNTTSFRVTNTPFQGSIGYAAFDVFLSDQLSCHMEEQVVFQCNLNDLANCNAKGTLNFQNQQWPCFLSKPVPDMCFKLSIPMVPEVVDNLKAKASHGCDMAYCFWSLFACVSGVEIYFVYATIRILK